MANEQYQRGLEAAAAFLEATADDYMQMAAKNSEEKRPIYRPGALAHASQQEAIARVLRGQAAHVRRLT